MLDFRYQERMYLLLSALHERRSLLRVASSVFVVLGIIAAGFLWQTAPFYALAAVIPVVAYPAGDLGLGVAIRRLRAGSPELRLPHLDYTPLVLPGEELPLYLLLLAGGMLAGLAVTFLMLFRF